MCHPVHLLLDLGWVDFDLGAPPSWPAAQRLGPNFHLLRQNWADSGTTNIKVNPTQSQVSERMNHPLQGNYKLRVAP